MNPGFHALRVVSQYWLLYSYQVEQSCVLWDGKFDVIKLYLLGFALWTPLDTIMVIMGHSVPINCSCSHNHHSEHSLLLLLLLIDLLHLSPYSVKKKLFVIFLPTLCDDAEVNILGRSSQVHYFTDLALCTEIQLCWSWKGTNTNCWHKVGSTVHSRD